MNNENNNINNLQNPDVSNINNGVPVINTEPVINQVNTPVISEPVVNTEPVVSVPVVNPVDIPVVNPEPVISEPVVNQVTTPVVNPTPIVTDNNNMVNNGILIKDDGLYYIHDKNCNLVYDRKRNRKLLGDHNLYNIAASLCVSLILKLDINKVCDLIDSFKPLEHRMEFVGTFNGISFYNDSIATIPSSCIYCIKSIPNTETAIVGGMDRGLDLSELINYFNSNECPLKTIIFLKDTGYNICDKLNELKCDKKLIKAEDMEDAVLKAYEYTNKGKACVLAPAAASYNVYKNFEERGKAYKDFIKKHKND